jgi:putative transposase
MAVDFKGEFKLGSGAYCYPLTVTDLYSRYLVDCVALPGPTMAETRRCFERIFARHGLPERIHSDNGAPFASAGIGNQSQLSLWWLQLGIAVERSRPAHPQDNAAHERMHRTLKAATTRPPEVSFRKQQRRFDAFRALYNHERPHEGIGGRVPADLYERSPRALPKTIEDWDYPAYFESRRIGPNGCFTWRGVNVMVGKAYVDQRVGLQAEDDARWRVYLGDLQVGTLDETTRRVEGCATKLHVPNRRRLP